MREGALGAYAHQDLPFEKLVEELAPERDLSRNPLFQVMFVLQNMPAPRSRWKAQVSRLPLESHSAKFDLSLSVRESAQGLQAAGSIRPICSMRPRSSAWRGTSSAARSHRGRSGASASASCRCSPSRAPPVTGGMERHRSRLPARSLHTAALRGTGRAHARGVAVVFEDRQLTYGELNARANQLAHQLIALGVGPEMRVGICLERSLELIVGLLAILKAGGAYVPLDPGYPKERLAFMLTDAQAPVLLTQQGLLGQFDCDGRIVCLDSDWETISTLP